jgi:hypothetical protein
MGRENYGERIGEVQLALKQKGILRTKEEIFNIMIELLKKHVLFKK